MPGPSGATSRLALPYPTAADNVDVPRDIEALATALDGISSVPVGALLMWPTVSPPAGFLLCNGALVPAATYPALAAVLGSSGGNITLPDLRDCFPVGAGATMALGTTGGAASVTLTGAQSGVPAHPHAFATNMPGNTIGFTRVNVQHGSGAFNNNFPAYSGAGVDSNQNTAPNNTAANAASSHENRPPYRAINFVIRAL